MFFIFFFPSKITGHDLRKRSHGLTLTATQPSFVRKKTLLIELLLLLFYALYRE